MLVRKLGLTYPKPSKASRSTPLSAVVGLGLLMKSAAYEVYALVGGDKPNDCKTTLPFPVNEISVHYIEE